MLSILFLRYSVKWWGWAGGRSEVQKICIALTGVAQWIECRRVNQKVAGSILSQGTCLGCGTGPQVGLCKRQPVNISLTHRCFSSSLSSSLPL